MTATEKWKGFIEQLLDVYLPIDPQDEARLRAELAVIEKTNGAEQFQTVYDAWHLLNLYGVQSRLIGEAEDWFVFYFLGTTRKNPRDKAMPTCLPSKLTLAVPKNQQEKARLILEKSAKNLFKITEL